MHPLLQLYNEEISKRGIETIVLGVKCVVHLIMMYKNLHFFTLFPSHEKFHIGKK